MNRAIRDQLPSLAKRFPDILPELTTFGRLLGDCPGALSELPFCILTAGFEAIGLAPLLTATDRASAGNRSRRCQYIEAATVMRAAGHHPRPEHIFIAVRLWGAVLGRAAVEYGGVAMHKRCERADKTPPKVDAKMDTAATTMAAFSARCAFDLHVLVAEAERMRAHGPEAYLRDHTACPLEAPIQASPLPSPQLDLFGAANAAAPTTTLVTSAPMAEAQAVITTTEVQTVVPTAEAQVAVSVVTEEVTEENTTPSPEELARFVRIHSATRPQMTPQPEAVV